MELSLSEIKELLRPAAAVGHSYHVGTKYLIRSVTHYYVGRLVSVTDTDLVLESASWVASTGRFHDCLKSGTLSEVEPFVHPVIVSRGGIIDATEWNHELPKVQK